jgi:thiamine-phosphate pyrophosphorylase
MKLAVISPPGVRDDELATVRALFDAGLERFHLRKPGWNEEQLARWLLELPESFHHKVFLHTHHALARRVAVGGLHFRDSLDCIAPVTLRSGMGHSRACHDAACLSAALGKFHAVFVAPIFPSLSKPGHGPLPDLELERIRSVLARSNESRKQTIAFALGGVTEARLLVCRNWGFDGVALLGAVWDAPNPVAAFRAFQCLSATLGTAACEAGTDLKKPLSGKDREPFPHSLANEKKEP